MTYNIYEKWREHKIDIQDLPLRRTRIIEEISYPHASNEITICYGFVDWLPKEILVKVSRRHDSNLLCEELLLHLLKQTDIIIPDVIESGSYKNQPFMIQEVLPGKRMSTLKKEGQYSYMLLDKFGKNLAKIHQLEVIAEDADERLFHQVPNVDTNQYKNIINWLNLNKPNKKNKSFIHGDHHYANVLFHEDDISAVLDWELAGNGWKEFDIAWARVLRPGQTFFKSKEEELIFLNAYKQIGSFDQNQYLWCKVLISLHFMLLSKDAKSEYCMYLENDINDAIREFEMNKKLCIFDLDGTLLDTLGGIRKTLNEVLKRNGYATYSVEEVRAKIGDGIKQLIMKSVNADDDVIEKLFHEFLELYKTTHMDDVIIYNGVYELLETLNKEQYKVCILSNKKHVYLEEISETFFKDLYLYAFGEGELPLKPDPTGINKILNLTDTKKDEALFIGDSEVDFKTAKNADVDFIAVSWGNRDKDQLELLGIEQIADNADELYDLIMKN